MIHGLGKIYLNTVFYLLFLIFSFLYIPLVSLAGLTLSPFVPHRTNMRRFRRAISWYGLIIIKVLPFPFIRIRYEDRDPDFRPGPYVIVCNHRSSSDAFLLACLPYEAVQVAKSWPFKIPVLGLYARLAGYLNVTDLPTDEFRRRAVKLLNEGACVAGFPEGTRSGNREIGQFSSSLFQVAFEAQCPVIPLCITGNEKVPPRGSMLMRPATIRIRKLRAIPWEEYAQMTPFKLKNHVRGIMREELAVMDAQN